MADLIPLVIYRVYNTTQQEVSFKTVSGTNVTIDSGGILDCYCFEVEGCDSFESLKKSGRIRVLEGQRCTRDSDCVAHLKDEIPAFRKHATQPVAAGTTPPSE